MKMTKKDLQRLLDLGAATELTNENCDDYNFWYEVVCRVYNSEGGLYAKVLVVSPHSTVGLYGRWFIARGSMAYRY